MGALDIALDFFILLLPLPVIRKLRMGTRKKISLIAVFFLGFLYVSPVERVWTDQFVSCVVSSGVRFWYLWQLRQIYQGKIPRSRANGMEKLLFAPSNLTSHRHIRMEWCLGTHRGLCINCHCLHAQHGTIVPREASSWECLQQSSFTVHPQKYLRYRNQGQRYTCTHRTEDLVVVVPRSSLDQERRCWCEVRCFCCPCFQPRYCLSHAFFTAAVTGSIDSCSVGRSWLCFIWLCFMVLEHSVKGHVMLRYVVVAALFRF